MLTLLRRLFLKLDLLILNVNLQGNTLKLAEIKFVVFMFSPLVDNLLNAFSWLTLLIR
jgi:hypothetical protein